MLVLINRDLFIGSTQLELVSTSDCRWRSARSGVYNAQLAALHPRILAGTPLYLVLQLEQELIVLSSLCVCDPPTTLVYRFPKDGPEPQCTKLLRSERKRR